jgi:hypothetical protein
LTPKLEATRTNWSATTQLRTVARLTTAIIVSRRAASIRARCRGTAIAHNVTIGGHASSSADRASVAAPPSMPAAAACQTDAPRPSVFTSIAIHPARSGRNRSSLTMTRVHGPTLM